MIELQYFSTKSSNFDYKCHFFKFQVKIYANLDIFFKSIKLFKNSTIIKKINSPKKIHSSKIFC